MTSTPEMELNNWLRFDETSTAPEWEDDDPDSVVEDDYSENSSQPLD